MPPVPPNQATAAQEAEKMRQRLAARRGYADSVKTSPTGAVNYGQNGATTGLSIGVGP